MIRAAQLGIESDDGDFQVVFLLEDNEYGYGYSYSTDNELPYQTMMYKDRFSYSEITSDKFDEMLGEENRDAFVGEHEGADEAVDEVLNFWSNSLNGRKVTASTFKEAIQIGRDEHLDFVVF
jgi:hypothetical protein